MNKYYVIYDGGPLNGRWDEEETLGSHGKVMGNNEGIYLWAQINELWQTDDYFVHAVWLGKWEWWSEEGEVYVQV